MQFQPIVRSIQTLGISLLGIGFINIIAPNTATAQSCNVYGCSQPGAGQCNVYGCPNPGADQCTVYGCPAAPPAPPPAPPQNNNGNGNGNNPSSRPSNAPNRPSNRSFQVTNGTGQDIHYLYVSVANQDDWSNDLLGDNILTDRQSWNMRLREGCVYDFSANLEDGKAIYWEDINICQRNRTTLTD
jgi:hypothetical protein